MFASWRNEEAHRRVRAGLEEANAAMEKAAIERSREGAEEEEECARNLMTTERRPTSS